MGASGRGARIGRREDTTHRRTDGARLRHAGSEPSRRDLSFSRSTQWKTELDTDNGEDEDNKK